MKLLALDPGQSNGWAIYKDGAIDSFGTLQWEAEFLDWFMEQDPDIIVAEDYIIRPKAYDHNFDKGVALQVLGAVKLHARRLGVPVVLQQPALKPGAYAHMGATYVKGKRGMHHMDAIAHGHEYLLQKRLLKKPGG